MKRKFYQFKIGDKSGKLTIVEILGRRLDHKRRELFYLCKCDCGNFIEMGHNGFQQGHTRSCGCLISEVLKGKPKTHGLTHHPYYKVWSNIRHRCFDVNHKDYLYYGGRGIEMYHEWVNDPTLFLEYLESLPNYNTPNVTVDRIDNNGNYEPNNLRFVSRIKQCNNQRIRKDNKSGYKGIWHDIQTDTYRVTVGINGTNVYCGTYKEIQDAIRARDIYIIKNNLLDNDMRLQMYEK